MENMVAKIEKWAQGDDCIIEVPEELLAEIQKIKIFSK